MTSEVEICNRALQKLGARRIVSLTEDSVSAQGCANAYHSVLELELREHPWNFAIKRIDLPAESTGPEWGMWNVFPLPYDCIRLLPNDPEMTINSHDWRIEGHKIITRDSAPLSIRYISRISTPHLMDSIFREVLATRLAIELCEELTQSNTKKNMLYGDYDDLIKKAKRTNAIETPPVFPPEDSWVTGRS